HRVRVAVAGRHGPPSALRRHAPMVRREPRPPAVAKGPSTKIRWSVAPASPESGGMRTSGPRADLLHLARPHRRSLVAAGGLSLTAVVLELARPWPLTLAVDHAIERRP